ncbi:DUF3995 domain-containing protein [Planomonospora parontospora]|uniref:DUF3995 domain-containing protein n=1 Tax=Planomonospora parontospora TaxID=58119 RepID=UPI001E3663C0|nr:DUF3995 domain-containing protein [Planomonospora parontospora]
MCTAAYGLMKLAQALGANALADKDPLPPDLRQRLLARDPLFVASHWILFAVAVVGVLVALATVRPWGERVPRRILLAVTWTVGGFMILRAFGPVGYGFVGDTLVLTGLQPPPGGHTELARELARWDLLLWSPFFLVWGLLWTATAWHLARTGRGRGQRSA